MGEILKYQTDTTEVFNEAKSQFLQGKSNKIFKFLGILIKKKKERAQISNIISKRETITTNASVIRYEQCYVN